MSELAKKNFNLGILPQLLNDLRTLMYITRMRAELDLEFIVEQIARGGFDVTLEFRPRTPYTHDFYQRCEEICRKHHFVLRELTFNQSIAEGFFDDFAGQRTFEPSGIITGEVRMSYVA